MPSLFSFPRARKRSLKGVGARESGAGTSACWVGGEGSWLGVGEGWSMDWSARQVEKRLLSTGAEDEEDGGGERGGEAKSMRDWKRVLGVDGCEESQWRADGSNMLAVFILYGFGVVVVLLLRSQRRCDATKDGQRSTADAPAVIGAFQCRNWDIKVDLFDSACSELSLHII